MLILQKEFLSALCMSALTILFATGLGDLYGEARTIPQILVLSMGVINLFQYAIAFWHGRKGANIGPALQAYPVGMVAKLFALTVAYLCTLLWLGFYIASLLYLLVGAYMADPGPVSSKRLLAQGIACGTFIFGMYALFTLALGVQIPLGSLWG